MADGRRFALALLLLVGAASAKDEELRDKANWLQFRDSWRRQEAVEWLYKQGPGAFGEVLRGLKSKHADARLIAVDLLLHYAKRMDSVERYGHTLARHLKDPSAEVRRKIGLLLEKAGPKNTNALVRALAYKNRDARWIAAVTLARFGDAVLPRLLKLLEAKSPRLRAGGVTALGRMKPTRKELVPQVLPLASDESKDVRAAAAGALTWIGLEEEKVLRKLVAMLADDSPRVYNAAKMAILESPEACSLLTGELSRDGGVPDERVLDAMGALRGSAPVYETAVLQADARLRVRLLETRPTWLVGRLSPEFAAQLVRWLEDGEGPMRRAAAWTLAHWLFPHRALAGKALRAHLADPDPKIRAAVLWGLTSHARDDPKTIAALRVASADPAPDVRAAALTGLWHLGEVEPDAVARLRELVTRHKSPAAALALNVMAPWSVAAVDGLIAASRSDDPELARQALRALGGLWHARSKHGLELRSARLADAPPRVRKACARALSWLAAHQDTRKSGVGRADGRWDSDGFVAHDAKPSAGRGQPPFDVGLTALALLAFLGAGHSDAVSPYAENVREGLHYLVREQREGGDIGARTHSSFLIQHGIATVALCEATVLGRDPLYREAAQKAVRFVGLARNPGYGWRYEPRGGENDTYHTAWMVTALRLGALAGLQVDPKAFTGASRILDKFTDPNFGQIGYNYPGGACARPVELGTKGSSQGTEFSQASTAQGLWAKILADPDLLTQKWEIGRKGADLCLDLSPEWGRHRTTIDLSYWHWGALVLSHIVPAKQAARWMVDLQDSLLTRQRPDGSWNPAGPWASIGGRLYSTSAAALALLAPYRFPRGFLEPDTSYPVYDRARKALEDGKRHKAWRCRIVAWTEAESFYR
jgi:HEAT repeat protein